MSGSPGKVDPSGLDLDEERIFSWVSVTVSTVKKSVASVPAA
jgi:hypothetical protein